MKAESVDFITADTLQERIDNWLSTNFPDATGKAGWASIGDILYEFTPQRGDALYMLFAYEWVMECVTEGMVRRQVSIPDEELNRMIEELWVPYPVGL
jgi:hypothetical protein